MRIGYDAKRIFHNNTGLGNYGRDLVRILSATHHIKQFALFNTKKTNTAHKKVVLDKSIIIYPKGLFWRVFPSLWRLIGQWKQIKYNKVDVYHGLSGEIPIQIRSSNIPKIVTIHDLIFLSHPQYYNFFDKIIYKLKFKYAAKKANHVIAISEQTKKDIVNYFKIDKNKISVIYQGCNAAFKKQYSSEELVALKQKFKLPEEFILNVGTLQERKNALTIIKAIKGTSYTTVLVGGEKKYAKKIHQYIAKNNLHHQVIFIKNVSSKELAMIYQNATIFCYPSICEGFGIPIIEALYSKLPVIVTKDGCFPEAAGPDSYYVNPLNIKEIKMAITELFENPDRRAKMAEKGYEYVQQFSDENVAHNLIKFYKSIN